MVQTARGEFVVSMKPMEFEGAPPESKLGRMSIDKQISGDLTARTTGQMLSAMTTTSGSAGYVALERVVGVPDGQRGSFVLQHTGTEELAGLQGEFTINIEDGIHRYEFTYGLPGQKDK